MDDSEWNVNRKVWYIVSLCVLLSILRLLWHWLIYGSVLLLLYCVDVYIAVLIFNSELLLKLIYTL